MTKFKFSFSKETTDFKRKGVGQKRISNEPIKTSIILFISSVGKATAISKELQKNLEYVRSTKSTLIAENLLGALKQ